MQERPVQPEESEAPGVEDVIMHVRKRAQNLYLSRQMLCAEAVVASLNHGLNGGLSDDQAMAVAAPFCVALGESGCLCGALSGAVLASGLFLGNRRPQRRRRLMRRSARELHDAFKAANGATCCRVLTRKVRHDPKAHFRQCAELTAQAAEMAARMILRQKPDLAEHANQGTLRRMDGGIKGKLLNLWRLLSPS